MAPSTTRALRKTKKKKVSPRLNDISTLNSVDETMSKLSPRTRKKAKGKKKPTGGRISPTMVSNSVTVVDEGDDSFDSDSLPMPSVTTKKPTQNDKMRRSNTIKFPKSKKKG